MTATLATLPLAASGVAAAIHARSADAPWSAETIGGLLAQSGVFGFVALTGEEPQGFVLCRIAADEAEVLTLAVLPEARRQGIARALVTNPDILLFDEPNTGLDPQTGQEIYELIKETQESSGFTGIVISHEIPEVFQVCDKVAMLYRGRVQLEGGVQELLKSESPVVKQFVTGGTIGPIEIG